MELNVNSPAYYTTIYGVDNEIYDMCRGLADYIRKKEYSKLISTIGIVPIVAPHVEIRRGLWKEVKKCETRYGFASISLQIDYEEYINADILQKKKMIIYNILKSVKTISSKGKIDYKSFEEDVKNFCRMNKMEI